MSTSSLKKEKTRFTLVILYSSNWVLHKLSLLTFFYFDIHTSSCGATVALSATDREVAGSNPAVDFDRCGLSPDELEVRTLSFVY